MTPEQWGGAGGRCTQDNLGKGGCSSLLLFSHPFKLKNASSSQPGVAQETVSNREASSPGIMAQ